MADKKFIP